MEIYIVCGYGTPKDITKDQNYLVYLSAVFNAILESSAGKPAAIIPCGGPTSVEPPFEGTEAGAMSEYLQGLAHNYSAEGQTSVWRFFQEDTSLSSLENLLFAKNFIDHESLEGSVTIFCEKTREHRMNETAKKVFGDRVVNVVAIDFDASKNRHLDPQIIEKKEADALAEALWTLEKPERLPLHHQLFEKKFNFLRERQRQGISHVDAVAEWFKVGPKILRELMPDHPLFRRDA